jgi:hypothetical protein
MGVITRCCTRESIISNSQISLYSNSDSDIKIQKINELPSNSDKNSAFQFITSDKLYKLLSQKISKNAIIGQMIKDMNTNEIILLMNELLKWINNFESKDNNKNIIDTIKINAKCSYEFLLKEMQKNNYEGKDNYFMIKAVSYMSLIVQSLLFLNNNENDKDDTYKINIWKDKDIIKETKKYGFQGAFFILLYKNKNININEGDKEKIKEELLQELNQYYKLSVNFCNDLVFD